MITTRQLNEALERQLAGTPVFVVAAEVRPNGKAVVEVDNDTHIGLDELAAINRGLHDTLGTALDDVELEVGSPGMGRPFRVMQQYRKHTGRLVHVTLNDGRDLEGVLEHVNDSGIGLRVQHHSKVKGRPPRLDNEVTALPFTQINETRTLITFK
jgi:ribosome maturation factor RimP